MDRNNLIRQFVVCPECFSEIIPDENAFKCSSCGKRYITYNGDILSTLQNVSADIDFSMEKWTEYYHNRELQEQAEKIYRESTLPLVLKQLYDYTDETGSEQKVFLEIGCGQAILGEEMAKRGWLFIGVDYSLHILHETKKRLDERGIENYLLIHGDITALPIAADSVDYIYGGGVIEHFKNNQSVVNHLHRALKVNGVSFNSVPFVNIGNIIYRSIWGSIPNLPILRGLAEFLHIRVLGGKHMRFGYELQMTRGQLRKTHLTAGFKNENIFIDRFDYTVTLEIIKNPILRKFFTYLIKNNSQFWQMVKVIAIKG